MATYLDKSRVVFSLKRMDDSLDVMPHRLWFDFAIVYGILQDDGMVHFLTNEDVIGYGTTETELYALAFQNTRNLLNPITSPSLVLSLKEKTELGIECLVAHTYVLAANGEDGLYSCVCGSAFVLYADLLEKVSDTCGDDLLLFEQDGWWLLAEKSLFQSSHWKGFLSKEGCFVYEYCRNLDLVRPLERVPVELISAMRTELDIYTKRYKEDFDNMDDILKRTAEIGGDDNVFYYMCRPNGAFLFHYEDVFIENSYANAALLGYQDDGRIFISMVEVTFLDESGKVYGHITPVPSYDRVKKCCVQGTYLPTFVVVTYPDEVKEVLPLREFWKKRNRYKKVEYVRGSLKSLQNIL